ncbi:hypothetical protein QBC37DRAFT_178945 [Rhypophila decipiens]|uniref:Uncharacterized protein n=1 Tax=Rhypophila decipiens TaxID=261697 RepID=A0AAN7BCE0_9PEZI|nr:hypothetical protein QBC37DRAFT_178945 [Rhypophila decipiens]
MAPAWWKSLRWSRDLDTSTENGTDVKYEALSALPGQASPRDSEIDDSLRDGNGQHRQSPMRRRGGTRLPWIISTVIFGLTTLILLVKISRGRTEVGPSCDCPGGDDRLDVGEFGTYKDGFNTELKTALAGLPVDEERWSGHLVYNASNAHWKIVYPPHEPRWVADPPNPAIDVMWNAVERGRTVYLQGPEADFVRERTTFENGYWVTGLDVFHQLHCLNSVRKALWPEYYHINGSDPIQKMHINHCLDYVRQALMCHADSTPIRRKFFPEAGVFGPDLTIMHTCRDIDGMMNWSLARSKMDGPGSEVPLNQSLVVTEEHPYADVAEPVHNE